LHRKRSEFSRFWMQIQRKLQIFVAFRGIVWVCVDVVKMI
jgi:hypothetical protein